MKKALLITALSLSISGVALADNHAAPDLDKMTEMMKNETLKKEMIAVPAPNVEAAKIESKMEHKKAHKKAHKNAHWGYTGHGAAHKWGALDAAYHACKGGVEQSPINIDQYIESDIKPLAISYNEVPLEVLNNGHTVQVNIASGSTFNVDGQAFELKQFHFHTPSEHYVDGAPYPMEMHFVHASESGALAVVSVMFKVGAHNPVIEGIWQNVPAAGKVKHVETVMINPQDLLPAGTGYYKYPGSLTTPPCSEGVHWHVMKDPIELSAKQLRAFQSVFPVNARPIQPINARHVLGD